MWLTSVRGPMAVEPAGHEALSGHGSQSIRDFPPPPARYQPSSHSVT